MSGLIVRGLDRCMRSRIWISLPLVYKKKTNYLFVIFYLTFTVMNFYCYVILYFIGLLIGIGTTFFLFFWVFTHFFSMMIKCALFGIYVDELNAFIKTWGIIKIIVVIHFAKVKFFKDNWHSSESEPLLVSISTL